MPSESLPSVSAPARTSKSGSPDDAQQRHQQGDEPGSLYKFIMTPLNFIVFLFSLLVVDLRYSLMRSHSHAEAPTRMPTWLHALLFRPQPYQYLRVKEPTRRGRWYYHSNQKKLMKMEAAEAFQIRNTMLVALALAVAATSGALWYLATHLYRHYVHSTWGS